MNNKATGVCTAIAAVVLWAAGVAGWGAVTHQSLTFSEGNYAFLTDYSFQLGTFSPDAFTGFNFGFHDLEYAGYQLQFAVKEYNSTSLTFDPITWSLGYGTHLSNDIVGFHPGGWLRDKTTFQEIFMSVDTYNLMATPQLVYRYFSTALDEVADFFSAASQYYAQSHPGFPPVTAAQVKAACSAYDAYSAVWILNVTANTQYQHELVATDPYAPKDWPTCEQQLLQQMHCCALVADYWIESTMRMLPPAELQSLTSEYADSLYEAGLCSPVS